MSSNPNSEKKNLRSPKLPEHLADSNAAEDAAIKALFQELAFEVGYENWSHIPVEAFKRLRRLATFDIFSEETDEKKSKWLGLEADDLPALRKKKLYKELHTEVQAAFSRITTPKSFKDHVADLKNQDALFRSTRRVALYAKDPKHSTKAQDVLIERVAPRALPGQQNVVVQIQAGYAKLLSETLSQLQTIEGEVVDAEHSDVQPTGDSKAEGEGKVQSLLLPKGTPG
jgi:hypothetical protein